MFNSRLATADGGSYDPELDANGDTDSAVTVRYDRHTNRSQLEEDPEYGTGYTARAAKGVARSVLKATAAAGLAEPPEGDVFCHKCNSLNTCSNPQHDDAKVSDRDLCGIIKNKRTGEWSYSRAKSKLANVRTLADYGTVPLETLSWKDEPNQNRNITLLDGVLRPSTHIGFDPNGEPVAAGQYTNTDKSGKIKTYIANPLQHLATAVALRKRIYNLHLSGEANEGGVDTKELFKDLADVTHLFHGSKITDQSPATEDDEKGSSWHGLRAGEAPLYGGEHVNHCVRNVAKNTQPRKSMFFGNKRRAAIANDIHRDAKTSDFVLCNCPTCATDQHSNVFNSLWDMQHHKKVASSSNPMYRKAYASKYGFGKGKNSVIGDPSILGPVAIMAHHVGHWATDSSKRHIKHLFRRHQGEKQAIANHQSPEKYRSSGPFNGSTIFGMDAMTGLYPEDPSSDYTLD